MKKKILISLAFFLFILSSKLFAENISGKIFCSHTSSMIGNIYALGIEFRPENQAIVKIETSIIPSSNYDSTYTSSASRIKITAIDYIKLDFDFNLEINRQNLEIYNIKFKNFSFIEEFSKDECNLIGKDMNLELLFEEVFKNQRKTNLI